MADSLWISVLVIVAAAVGGLGLAFAPIAGFRKVGPIRTFALAAALAVTGAHLLPEAFSVLGLYCLAGVAIGAVVPDAVEHAANRWWGRRTARKPDGALALEVGYAGLLVHRVGDGLSIAAYGGTWHGGHVHGDVVVALAAHMVPVTTVVALSFQAVYGIGTAVRRTAGLVLASFVGVAIATVTTARAPLFEAWVAAIVTGLLLHVVLRDLEADRPENAVDRTLDLSAGALGLVVPLAIAGGHAGPFWQSLRALAYTVAPYLLIGVLCGAGARALRGPVATALRAPHGGLLSSIRAAFWSTPLSTCSCAAVPTAEELDSAGAPPAWTGAVLVGAPLLGVETVTVTAGLFGWSFAGARFGLSFLAAVTMGLVLHHFAAPRPHPAAPIARLETAAPYAARFAAALDRLVFHAGAWFTLGLLLAALADVALAPGEAATAGGWLLAAAFVTGLAAPVYLCASALTPLAAVLVESGLPVAAVVIAFVVGPTTGRAAFHFARRAYGARAVFTGALSLLALTWLGGWLIETHLPIVGSVSGSLAARAPTEIEWIAGAALVLLLVRVVWRSGARAWLAIAFTGRATTPAEPRLVPSD